MLFNIRFGHACNSSSTHSMMIAPNVNDSCVEYGEHFGWDFWTAASDETKLSYIGSILYSELKRIFPDYILVTILNDWLGTNFNISQLNTEFPGVDHQSCFALPYKIGEKGIINKEFFTDLKNYILQKDLVILGGNDNDNEKHPLYNSSKNNADLDMIPCDVKSEEYTARKDGDQWTIFNRKTGAKVRFSFDKNSKPVEKLTSPELVDVKITDKCPYDCNFCYQGSTKTNPHGSIYMIPELLADAEVFECAIGGGEPTIHPEFQYLLENLNKRNINANFTTRNFHLFNDEIKLRNICENIGSFAFSVHITEEAKIIKNMYNKFPFLEEKLSVQVIEGILSTEDIADIANTINPIPLTILGFKNQNRGTNIKTLQVFNFNDFTKKLSKDVYRISVDTSFINKYESEIKKLKFPNLFYQKREGAVSCYIDTVANKIGPSSYSKNMIDLDYTVSLKEQFLKLKPE